MSNVIGWAGRIRGLFSDKGGPWGPSGGEGGKPSRPRPDPAPDDNGPWGGDPGHSAPGGRGISSLEDLLRRGRAHLGGGGGERGGGFGDGSGRPYLLWGVVGFVLLWLIVTSFHSISPGERGVVTRLGRYSATLGPGVSLTLPSPIDRVQKIDVENIRSIELGSNDRDKLMLTGDQNLLDIAYSVRWNIRSPELYLFELAQPDSTISEVAESAMRSVISRVSLNEAMGDRRADIEVQVAELMQQILNNYRSGITIQGIAIKQADPPDPVNDAFKQVTAAQQDAQTFINNANAYSLQLRQKAQGEATAFDKVYEQYRLAPNVTRRRMYYETMEAVLSKIDKTIVEAPGVTPYLPLPQIAKERAQGDRQ
ncbi:MAG: FtsH protease activity modulator HflK [Sphingomicrobium sp.]